MLCHTSCVLMSWLYQPLSIPFGCSQHIKVSSVVALLNSYATETPKSDTIVGFKMLTICKDMHFMDVVLCIWGEDMGGQVLCLFLGC